MMVRSRASELKHQFAEYAPKKNQENEENAFGMHKHKANVSFSMVQDMVMALYSPSLLGREKV
jgi:hypothetical protein